MDERQASTLASTPDAGEGGLLDAATILACRVRALYQEVILLCVHHGIHRWWDCLGPHPFCGFDSIGMLRRLLRELLLLRAGDGRNFLRLTRLLDASGGRPSARDLFSERLAEIYAEHLLTLQAAVRPLQGEKGPLLFVCPIWGPAQRERFQASLLAKGRLSSLCQDRAPVLLIHADAQGEALLHDAPALAEARALGLDVHFLGLDPGLSQCLDQDPGLTQDWPEWFIFTLEAQPRLRVEGEDQEDCAPSSVQGMMNGLLSLHGAETHPEAQDRVGALRREAHAIWQCGRQTVEPASDPGMMAQVLRWLCHFDLLDDAREALARYAPGSALDRALSDWHNLRDLNARVAGKFAQNGPEGRVPTLIGMTVWGASYLSFLLEYHLPSLFAEGNLPSLARRGKVLYSIVTDAKGRQTLQDAPAFATLRTFAECHFTVVDPLPERVTEEGRRTFYQRVGLLDHHHVYLAKTLRAALVLLPPDTIVSRGGLHALAAGLAEGADCCTTAGMEGDFQAVQPTLDAHKTRGVLALAAQDLIAIAVRHRTPYFESLIVTPGNRLNANPREFYWRLPRGFLCHSIFMHPLILSARVMGRDFHPNHENVDWALLPRALGGYARIRVLGPDSGLFIMHCSNEREKPTVYAPVPNQVEPALGKYLLSVHQHDFPIHRDLFHRPQFFPMEASDLPVAEDYLEASARLLAMFDSATFRCGACS